MTSCTTSTSTAPKHPVGAVLDPDPPPSTKKRSRAATPAPICPPVPLPYLVLVEFLAADVRCYPGGQRSHTISSPMAGKGPLLSPRLWKLFKKVGLGFHDLLNGRTEPVTEPLAAEALAVSRWLWRQYDSRTRRGVAMKKAWDGAFRTVERELNRHSPPPTDPTRCAGCGGMIADGWPAAMTDGAMVHTEHPQCTAEWESRWRPLARTRLLEVVSRLVVEPVKYIRAEPPPAR